MVKNEAESPTPTGLKPVESEIIHFFVQAASALSIPRSVGEIFGLLFCATEPQPFETIVSKLGISKGSTSQGLKFLVKIGAVSIAYIPRDRRTFYQAETSVRRLVSGAIQETIRPNLESNREALRTINEHVSLTKQTEPDLAKHLESRVESLHAWNEKAIQLLPWLARLASLKMPDFFSETDEPSRISSER